MQPDLTAWDRPYYQPGGGDAFLFYVVYGEFDLSRPLSRSKYRCSGIPEGLDIGKHSLAEGGEKPFADDYFLTLLQEQPALAAQVLAAPQWVTLSGEITDPPTLGYLKDAIGIVTWLLDVGGVGVVDPQILAWREADAWRQQVFAPEAFDPYRETALICSAEEDGSGTDWLHSRGLRKFGRPDLSIHRVTRGERPTMHDLLNRFLGLLTLGGTIAEGQEVRVPGVPPGTVCRYAGDLDDPDFNNLHVEIVRP